MNKRRKIFIAVIAIMLFSYSTLASSIYAQDADETKGDPVKKLGRGIANTLLGFLELPKTIEDTGKKDGVGPAISLGFIKGLAKAVARTIVGVYETASFWIPVPEDYKPIITDPEYIFQKQGL